MKILMVLKIDFYLFILVLFDVGGHLGKHIIFFLHCFSPEFAMIKIIFTS